MSTLDYISNKYKINTSSGSPIFLPHTRKDLASLFCELDFKTGAEIGVLNGAYSKILCEANPKVELYCIDPWEIYEEMPEIGNIGFGNYVRQINRGFEYTKELLSKYSCKFIKKYSMDAVKDFEKDSLDFVYIDANHLFDYVMRDIIEWSRIVRPGGIVSGHDYHCFKHKEVSFQISTAVDTYIRVHNINPLFVLNGDKSSSWFFVKP